MTTQGFSLDRRNAKVMGVCAGLSNRFGVDATLLRVALVVATLCGFGLPALAYVVTGLIAN